MTTTVTQDVVAPAQPELDPRRWIAFSVVLVASFMILLDISIVNVAIPSIQNRLHASYAQIQWVLAGYQLGYAVVLITGGRLGDIVGRKTMFIIGVSGFTLASALCGLAQSPEMLIGSRIFQGVMAALMYPQVLSVIQVSFPPRERGKAFGVFGGLIGVATISGPLLGGLLIQADIHLGSTDLDWRPIFLVNVPVGIGAVVAAFVFLHESKAAQAPRLDIPGVILASTGLFLLAYPLVEGRDQGWPLWTWLMFAGAAIVLATFGIYQRRRAAGGRAPLVEPVLFQDRSFVVGILIATCFFAGIPAFFLTFSIFLQIGLGYTALHTGLTTLPFALMSAVASGASIRLAPKLGRAILLLGCALLTVGMLGIWVTVQAAGTGVSTWELVPAMGVSGLGLGCMVAPLINVILAGIHQRNAGSASGVLTTVQQIGGALGVCVIGIVFFGQLSANADTAFANVQGQVQSSVQANLPAQIPAEQRPATAQRITAGVAQCFHDRGQSSDPTADPPSCQQGEALQKTAPPALTTAIQQQVGTALAQNFLHAMQISLFYEAAIFVITLLLINLLPGAKPQAAGGPGGGH